MPFTICASSSPISKNSEKVVTPPPSPVVKNISSVNNISAELSQYKISHRNNSLQQPNAFREEIGFASDIQNAENRSLKKTADKIKSIYKEFQTRKNNCSENNFDWKVMANKDIKYYFDISGVLSTYLRTPRKSVPQGRAGRYKTETRCDNYFIQLSNHRFSENEARIINQLAKELNSFSSVCAAYYVEIDTMIAKNAGVEVFDMRNRGEILNINSFKVACEDLDIMHRQNIYIRDIKPENMAFKNGVVKHIDIDYFITPKHSIYDYNHSCKTVGYCTQSLILGRMSEDKCEAMKSLRSGDQFAMLTTMMISTGSPELACTIHRALDATYKNNGMSITEHHMAWVFEHIKKQFYIDIIRFTKEPSVHSLDKPLHTMIKWDASD